MRRGTRYRLAATQFDAPWFAYVFFCIGHRPRMAEYSWDKLVFRAAQCGSILLAIHLRGMEKAAYFERTYAWPGHVSTSLYCPGSAYPSHRLVVYYQTEN